MASENRTLHMPPYDRPHRQDQRAGAPSTVPPPTYDAAAVLQREIGDRMLERLDYVRLQPQTILDLGCGTGHAIAP